MKRKTTAFPRITLLVIAVFAPLAFAPNAAHAQDPAIGEMMAFVQLMQSFFGIIDSMHDVSDDPEKSAIFHLHKIQEVYEEQGDKSRVIPVMRDVLERSSSPTIRSATYLMLGDVLKEAGQRDEAIKVLKLGLDEAVMNADQGR